MMATDPIISLKNVHKSFPLKNGESFRALDDVSFDIFRGEVVALIGPSGSGKSTSLRVINALETIQRGTVTVGGLCYRQKPAVEIRRKTAMIFQRFELFPHLTVLDNVALAPKLVCGKNPKDAKEIAADLLTKVGLSQHMLKYPRALSGGQQQRVAIARALAVDPQVLLCDEPTSALDPELVHEVLELLEKIAKQGMTMVIVTHEIRFAQKFAHRCLFLDHGKVLEESKTSDFFAEPKHPRLQQFLKKLMN